MRVLVIAPHPDDEAIGLGGRIRQHVLAGDEVEVLLLTQGELGCPGEDLAETGIRRVHEAMEASKVLGSSVLQYWDYPDGNFKADNIIVNRLCELWSIRFPSLVYVPGGQDAHPDHRAANDLVRYAYDRGMHHPDVLMYEVWTPLPEYDEVHDITDVIGTKLTAIRRHESQVKRIRFDEAALSLARFRGELHNRPHGPYAEVFQRMFP